MGRGSDRSQAPGGRRRALRASGPQSPWSAGGRACGSPWPSWGPAAAGRVRCRPSSDDSPPPRKRLSRRRAEGPRRTRGLQVQRAWGQAPLRAGGPRASECRPARPGKAAPGPSEARGARGLSLTPEERRPSPGGTGPGQVGGPRGAGAGASTRGHSGESGSPGASARRGQGGKAALAGRGAEGGEVGPKVVPGKDAGGGRRLEGRVPGSVPRRHSCARDRSPTAEGAASFYSI